MTQQANYIVVFLIALACLPMLAKWLIGRNAMGKAAVGAGAKIISVVAVGPSQRVVTLEAGPEHDRLCLVLGVTAQNITCLHRSPASPAQAHRSKPATALQSTEFGAKHV